MDLGRIERLRTSIEMRAADVAVISPGPNLRYLADMDINPYERTFMLFISKTDMAFVLPILEEEKVSRAVGGAGVPIFAYRDEEGPIGTIRSALKAVKADPSEKRLCLCTEQLHMRVKEFLMLKTLAGDFTYKNADSMMLGLRIIKDKEEFERLRNAAEIVDIGIKAARAAIKPGVTEKKVAKAIEDAMLEAGADSVPFNAVLSGPRAALPHGDTSDRVILDDEFVLCDIGAVYKGYYGDITRTIPVGRPPDKMIQAYEAVYEANIAARDAVKPGITSEALDAICRDIISSKGFGDFFIHRTGHGIGLEVHEEPYIVKGDPSRIIPGMAFTIEPGVYIPGLGGVRIEDDVLIGSRKAEVITKSPRYMR
ncbi:MAG TPA: Xaa-Pro peptidase family protein [Bacillota bacterium]|nr:aminopeptidase P family protein [Bacillota bacterium]HOG52543.1 Xaa-Pro peptidase family protein [Bacillota bacterium]